MNTSTIAQFTATEIAHADNMGRFEKILLDLSKKGLTQSVFQNFDSEIEPVIAIAIDDPDIPAEWTVDYCLNKSQELLDNNLEEFGTKPDGSYKTRSCKVTVGDEETTITVDPTELVLPEREVKVICMTHNRRVNSLHAKVCAMGVDEVVRVRVLPYAEALAIAERENVIKMHGFKGLSKKDLYILTRRKIADGSICSEADMYKKLNIERSYAQAIYGAALKGRQSKEFDSQVMKDKIKVVSEINGEPVEHHVSINDFNNKAGLACKKANGFKDIAAAVGGVLKPKGEKSKNAVSGAEMRKMAESAMPLVKALLTALANGEKEQANKLILTKLTDLEIQ